MAAGDLLERQATKSLLSRQAMPRVGRSSELPMSDLGSSMDGRASIDLRFLRACSSNFRSTLCLRARSKAKKMN